MTEHDLETDCGAGLRFFCDLSALDVAQQKRRFLLDQLLQVSTVDIVELPMAMRFMWTRSRSSRNIWRNSRLWNGFAVRS